MRRVMLAALLAIAAAWTVAAQSGATAAATLHVVSDCDGSPVAGVEVDVNGVYLGQTDASGTMAGTIATGTSYGLTLYQGQYAPWHGAFATDGPIALTIALHRVYPGC